MFYSWTNSLKNNFILNAIFDSIKINDIWCENSLFFMWQYNIIKELFEFIWDLVSDN